MSATVNTYGSRLGMAVALHVAPGSSINNLNVMSRAVDRTRGRFHNLRYALNDVKYGMDNLRTAVRPFAMAGGIAGMLGLREVYKYDKALHEVGAAIGRVKFNAQKSQIDQLIRMTALQKENVASVEEATEAYQILARSGYGEGEKAAKGMSTVLKMVTNDAALGAKTAAKALIQIKEGFGLADDQIEHVGNTLARTSDAIPGNISDLVTVMRYLGPAVSQKQGTLEEAMTLAAVGISRGLAPSTTGTSFNQFMAQMSKPGKRKKLEDTLGISLTDNGKWKGLMFTIDEIVKGLERMSDVEASDLITDVFGIRPGRGLSKFMTGLTTGGAAFQQYHDYVTKGADLREKSEIISDSMSSIIKAYGSALSSMSIDFFGEMFNTDVLAQGRNNLIKIAEALLLIRKGESDTDILGLNEGMKQEHIDVAHQIKKVAGDVAEVFTKLGNTIKSVAEFVGVDFFVSFIALSPVIMIVSGILGVVSNLVRGVGLLGLAFVKAFPIIKKFFPFLKAGIVGAFTAMTSWGALKAAVWTPFLAFLGKMKYELQFLWLRLTTATGGVTNFRGKLAVLNVSMAQTGVKAKIAAAGFWAMRAGATVASTAVRGLSWVIRTALGPLGIVIGIIAELAGAFSGASGEIDRTANSLKDLVKLTERENQIKDLMGHPLSSRGMRTRAEAIAILEQREKKAFEMLEPGAKKGAYGEELFSKAWGITEYSRQGKKLTDPFIAEELGSHQKAQRARDLISGLVPSELARLTGGDEQQASRMIQIYNKLSELEPNSFSNAAAAAEALGLTSTEAAMMTQHFKNLNQAIAKAKDSQEVSVDALGDVKNLRSFLLGVPESEIASAAPKAGTKDDVALKSLGSQAAQGIQFTLQVLGLAAGGVVGAEGEAAGEADGYRDPCLNAHLTTNIDGRKVASAVAQVNMDVARRGGANMTPYQRVKILQDGAVAPVVPGGKYA